MKGKKIGVMSALGVVIALTTSAFISKNDVSTNSLGKTIKNVTTVAPSSMAANAATTVITNCYIYKCDSE